MGIQSVNSFAKNSYITDPFSVTKIIYGNIYNKAFWLLQHIHFDNNIIAEGTYLTHSHI